MRLQLQRLLAVFGLNATAFIANDVWDAFDQEMDTQQSDNCRRQTQAADIANQFPVDGLHRPRSCFAAANCAERSTLRLPFR